ncbi:LysM peptidoglycan-binding domain-containing protein [Aliiroseovarius crassostreae]|uniref:LysM peptidoglycan-binding domain-containing protein n=1 Tax=Aliiroseovarius crassostreae TaxID=154981 RepID=A0A9Q9LWV1_9RHOB|nr:LysM peptidoglycan-binding domain-containing protein [Aliiroseovarius crassostreae]UWP94907.1 LysM peptidoglycan-binding domain-containing protein [Aliiroseovarius crassostreae]
MTRNEIYKYALIGGGFFSAVLILILLQPNTPDMETALPSVPQAAPQEMAEPISQVTTVSASVDTPTSQATQAPAGDDLLDLTNSVLAGLGVEKTPPETDPLREMTSSVLAGLGVPPITDTGRSEGTQISQASDDQIRALLSEAIDRGMISVPAAMRTAEGEIDKDTLINQLARATTGETAHPPSDELITGGKGVEVRVVQQADKTFQYRFYTVQRGDSLGAIAQKFYGDAGEYTRIFDANRRLLPTPDQIRAGQRLTIPSLSTGA